VDFVGKPELMADCPYTLRSAVAFWVLHGPHNPADAGATDAAVDRITGVVKCVGNMSPLRRREPRRGLPPADIS
jgi:predicted chitinase